MAKKKKKKVSKKLAAPAADSGRRLTAEVKEALLSAPSNVTNAALAEKYGTSLQTVARYRAGSRRKGRIGNGGAEAETITMSKDGDFVLLRIHKSRTNVVQSLVTELLG